MRRALLHAARAAFVATVALYALAWMYAVRRQATGRLGVEWDEATGIVRRVLADSPAEAVGLRTGDRLVRIDGQHVDRAVFRNAVVFGRPGDRLRLEVDRPGESVAPVVVALAAAPAAPPRSPAEYAAFDVARFYPILLLAAIVSVLALRIDDPHAWWLALLLACFVAAAPEAESNLPASLWGFAAAFHLLLNTVNGAVFLFFFSVFPERSPLDRRLPFLKWLGLAILVPTGLGLAAWALREGSEQPVGSWLLATPLSLLHAGPGLMAISVLRLLVYLTFALGLVSLVGNALSGSPTVRRKVHLLVLATLLGPGVAWGYFGVANAMGLSGFEPPIWVWLPFVIAVALFPLAIVYAVVRHRVLEVPALLRLSARYLLVQRGFGGLLLLAGSLAALAFSLWLSRVVPQGAHALAAVLGVAFGGALVWSGSHAQRRLRGRIDRAFFRGAYDARRILEELAEAVREIGSRGDLANVIERQVASALLPSSLAVYVRDADGVLRRMAGPGQPRSPAELSERSAVVEELARRGEPIDLAPGGDPASGLAAECLVPIRGRQGTLDGIIALGPRRSEEPYTREDQRLLVAVASQAAIALGGIRLAEQIAERVEAERRASHELELAQGVQRRLLPQQAPRLATAELHGTCVQARAVGGDYFDFLDLGPRRVGLVLGDVSGKGLPAALLMSSLQASLRSRSATDYEDLCGPVRATNRLLYRSSEASRYSTLFLAVYDDATRRLRFANCGHNPPVLLKGNASVTRLAPTGTVLGLFPEWDGGVDERFLEPGDLLAVYSDGITEAFDGEGAEFGEDRLVELLLCHRDEPPPVLAARLLEAVRAFAAGDQQDDQTLLIARVL